MNSDQKLFGLGVFEGSCLTICGILVGKLVKDVYGFFKYLKD